MRYGGIFASAAHFRRLLIPPAVQTADPCGAGVAQRCEHDGTADNERRSRWRPWAELLKRTFDIDLVCPRCHGPMKLKSFLTDGKSLQRLLSSFAEPSDVQGKAPARRPPYFASRVLRRRFAEQTTQLDMLD